MRKKESKSIEKIKLDFTHQVKSDQSNKKETSFSYFPCNI